MRRNPISILMFCLVFGLPGLVEGKETYDIYFNDYGSRVTLDHFSLGPICSFQEKEQRYSCEEEKLPKTKITVTQTDETGNYKGLEVTASWAFLDPFDFCPYAIELAISHPRKKIEIDWSEVFFVADGLVQKTLPGFARQIHSDLSILKPSKAPSAAVLQESVFMEVDPDATACPYKKGMNNNVELRLPVKIGKGKTVNVVKKISHETVLVDEEIRSKLLRDSFGTLNAPASPPVKIERPKAPTPEPSPEPLPLKKLYRLEAPLAVSGGILGGVLAYFTVAPALYDWAYKNMNASDHPDPEKRFFDTEDDFGNPTRKPVSNTRAEQGQYAGWTLGVFPTSILGAGLGLVAAHLINLPAKRYNTEQGNKNRIAWQKNRKSLKKANELYQGKLNKYEDYQRQIKKAASYQTLKKEIFGEPDNAAEK